MNEPTNRLLSTLGSPALAAINLLVLAAAALLALTPDRSVLTGLLILTWGAIAALLAYHAGAEGRMRGRHVVFVYAAATALLYIILNGLYRLLGA